MKKTLALAAVALSLGLAGCSGEPPLNEESTREEIHAYITDNGATIRQQDTSKYMTQVCALLRETDNAKDAAGNLKDAHGGGMTVEQAQKNVGAAVLTTCPEWEHKLNSDVSWW